VTRRPRNTQPTVSETITTTIAVFVPVARIDAAREESRAYYLTQGKDLPAASMLVDEVHDSSGQLIGYSCELEMSVEAADHMMQYYRDQFVGTHKPAQRLYRKSLDRVLQQKSARCDRHEQRKAKRQQRRTARLAEDRRLQAKADAKRRRRRRRRKGGPS